MAAVADLPDSFARAGLQVLRGTGLRVGELLDLELDAVVDYGPAGTWLRVPLGKLATNAPFHSTSRPWQPSISGPTDGWSSSDPASTHRQGHRLPVH